MADKLTQHVLDALTRAAAESAGSPLYATKSEPGLFPSNTVGKSAARKALDDGYLAMVPPDAKNRAGRELAILTEKGREFLLEQVSPKQVLEDFVRVLESREQQVHTLLDTAKQMAESLVGLRATVSAMLPQVTASRCSMPRPTPSPASTNGAVAHRLHSLAFAGDVATMPAVATLEEVVDSTDTQDELAGAVQSHLADWAASAGAAQDCPLPELFRSLSLREHPPSIGTFHDCLRELHANRQVYLHPWTGPLYTLPEPAYALLVGHEIAYYASSRS